MEQKSKDPRGRPTKYDPSYPKQVLAYLKTCGRGQTKLPKRVDVAIMLDVDEDTLLNWSKVHDEFLYVMNLVDMRQKAQLMDDSFYGGKEVNHHIGQFLLSVNHGMIPAEKQLLEVTGDYNIIDDISGKRISKATT